MRVGNREVVQTVTLLVPDGESAWVALPIKGWTLKLEIVLKKDTATAEAGISVDALGDHGRLTLINWNNVLGTSTKVPIQLATLSNGQRVVAMIWHAQTGVTGKLDVQFMLDGEPSK
jgi:hypothetical protein